MLMSKGSERVLVCYGFEEYGSREEALERAKRINLQGDDEKRIFVVAEEVAWPHHSRAD